MINAPTLYQSATLNLPLSISPSEETLGPLSPCHRDPPRLHVKRLPELPERLKSSIPRGRHGADANAVTNPDPSRSLAIDFVVPDLRPKGTSPKNQQKPTKTKKPKNHTPKRLAMIVEWN